MINPNNNLERIYSELGDNICLYPFFAAFYQTNNKFENARPHSLNSVRPCSVILENDQSVWDIKNNSIVESRNLDYWREVRQKFIEKSCHEVSGCSACSYNEKSGATSARKMNNHFFSEFLSCNIVDEVKKIINNQYCTDTVRTLDYFPSNYCNYECVMCDGGASSTRFTFEIKIQNIKQTMQLNQVDADFYDILNNVEVINFTGGETVLQNQIVDLIDYLIEKDLAKNIVVTLLTNASSFPEKLETKLRKFKDVFFTISIDGINDVIEYQRRRCKWEIASANAVKIYYTFGSVINYVLTAINVFSFTDFVEWAYNNKMHRISVSPVFRHDYYSAAVIPNELKNKLIEKLKLDRQMFNEPNWARLFDQVIGVLETTTHQPELIPEFVKKIQQEDSVSKKKLIEVVPEWKSYFE
jgi:molybdenum cofactor biosynthesis enzyme MoaA